MRLRAVRPWSIPLLAASLAALGGCNAEGGPLTTAATSSLPGSTTLVTTSTEPTDVSTPPDSTTSSIPSQEGLIEHPSGAVFLRPRGWSESGAVVATAFSAGADCRSAHVIDRLPPSDSGPAPSIEQSMVQVCARPAESQSLRSFLEATYGSGIPGFVETAIGGRDAYRSGEIPDWVIFVQTEATRYQIVTSVFAATELEAARTADVLSIIESFEFR